MAQVTFQTNLGKFEKATKEQLAKAAEIIGGMAESFAKQHITEQGAVDTGNLRNSITHAAEDEGRTVVIGTSVEYAPYVELGTYKMKAKPYLRPAIENHIDEYKNVMQMVLGK